MLDLYFAQLMQPAMADSKPEVVISVDDSGEELEWLVTYNQEKLLSVKGEWITGINGDPSAASVSILTALRDKLIADKIVSEEKSDFIVGDYCTISFVFPDFEACLTNEKIDGVYLERDIDVSTNIKAYTTSPSMWFEYRTKGSDEDFKRAYPAKIENDCVTFPSDVGTGEYEIRLVASYVTAFDVRGETPIEYTSELRSNLLECKIAQASINIPTNAEIEITYGDSLDILVSKLSELLVGKGWNKANGTFTLAEKQTESCLADVEDMATFYLDTSRVHSVVFDFEPESDSYARDRVTVGVRVNPKPISLEIDDSFSVEGEPLNYPGYRLRGEELVGNDIITDLGVVFKLVDNSTDKPSDGSASGIYRVYADFQNKNYTIDRIYSTGNKYADYAIYNVYKRLTVTLDGEISAFISLHELVQNVTAVLERVYFDEPLVVEGRQCLYAYKVVFYDENGEVFEPSQDYVVQWSDAPRGATWASGDSLELVDMTQFGSITVKHEQGMIYFFADVEPASLPIWVYVVVDIAVAIVFVLIVLKLKRKLICKNSYKNYFYQYENATLNADCDNISPKSEHNESAPKTAKKPRHGKNNKERNGAKRDSNR